MTIRFVAGYGDHAEDIPQAVRQGILIEISNLYENREDVVVGQNISMLSGPYRALTVE